MAEAISKIIGGIIAEPKPFDKQTLETMEQL
jgi:hypothetical protein